MCWRRRHDATARRRDPDDDTGADSGAVLAVVELRRSPATSRRSMPLQRALMARHGNPRVRRGPGRRSSVAGRRHHPGAGSTPRPRLVEGRSMHPARWLGGAEGPARHAGSGRRCCGFAGRRGSQVTERAGARGVPRETTPARTTRRPGLARRWPELAGSRRPLRIPAPACQHVRLAAYEDWMRGPLVCPSHVHGGLDCDRAAAAEAPSKARASPPGSDRSGAAQAVGARTNRRPRRSRRRRSRPEPPADVVSGTAAPRTEHRGHELRRAARRRDHAAATPRAQIRHTPPPMHGRCSRPSAASCFFRLRQHRARGRR